MVANAATLGRSGVHDYIIIRVAGINLALYAFFLLGFFLTRAIEILYIRCVSKRFIHRYHYCITQ